MGIIHIVFTVGSPYTPRTEKGSSVLEKALTFQERKLRNSEREEKE